jgi:hypothetical protein
MIVNARKPVADAGGNDDHGARLEAIGDAGADGRPVAARAIEVPHVVVGRRPALHTHDFRTRYEGGFAFHDVIDLADQVVLGDRHPDGLTRDPMTRQRLGPREIDFEARRHDGGRPRAEGQERSTHGQGDVLRDSIYRKRRLRLIRWIRTTAPEKSIAEDSLGVGRFMRRKS